MRSHNYIITIVCSGNSTDSTVSSATTVTTAAGTESEREDRQQGISTKLIGNECRAVTKLN